MSGSIISEKSPDQLRPDRAEPAARRLGLPAHPVWGILLTTFATELVMEMLCRRSFIQGAAFLLRHPLLFLVNMFVITATVSPALAFRRRIFFIALPTAVWLSLGVADCLLLSFRATPLAAIDFGILPSVFSIMEVYLTPWQFVLICVCAVLLIAGLVILYIKAPVRKSSFREAFYLSFVSAVTAAAVLICISGLTFKSNQFSNLSRAYAHYGFPLSFSLSLFDRGISEPMSYSHESVDSIVDVLDEETGGVPAARENRPPNIIVLQLESFFDVKNLVRIECSQDPTPVFSQLKRRFPSGYLAVPSVGSGTVNTEFEILTGMNLDYFGVGEYPYKTILTNSTCETAAYNLREAGYTAHAIHNHNADFYDRHIVFSHMGFDTFTPIEYMSGIERNSLGWARDDLLTGEIMSALRSTDGQDFICAISVYCHGKYPTVRTDDPRPIRVAGCEDGQLTAKYEYYVNRLYETDAFLGELIRTLSSFDEETVLVMYGDHLPSLEITDGDLINRDIFQTEYVIWSNFGLKAKNEDLAAYQLIAHVMELNGLDNGIFTKLHQSHRTDPDYETQLNMLEYDTLFGDRLAYGGKNPFLPTELQMGLHPVRITGIRLLNDDACYIEGERFTEYSRVFVDGREKQTLFIDDGALIALDTGAGAGSAVEVAQIGSDNLELSRSSPYTIK